MGGSKNSNLCPRSNAYLTFLKKKNANLTLAKFLMCIDVFFNISFNYI